MWVSRPEEASNTLTAAARCASWNGGAGISVRRHCWSLIHARLRANQFNAARTEELSAILGEAALRRACGTLGDLTGMVKRITQSTTAFMDEFRRRGAINCVQPRHKELAVRCRSARARIFWQQRRC